MKFEDVEKENCVRDKIKHILMKTDEVFTSREIGDMFEIPSSTASSHLSAITCDVNFDRIKIGNRKYVYGTNENIEKVRRLIFNENK